MRNAPTVQYPVGCPRFLMLAGGVLWAAGTVFCGCWLTLEGYPAWRTLMAISALVATAWLAIHTLRHLKTGLLRWDGETWHWSEADEPGTEVPLAQVGVEIDLQSRMALQIALADGNSSWIWVEAQSLPSDWLALRRALFSPVKTRKRTAGMSEPAPMRMDVA